jgi:hypothetical protein
LAEPSQGRAAGATNPSAVSNPARASHRTWIVLAIAVWAMASASGVKFLVDYAAAPGAAGSVPIRWPAQAELALSSKPATLVVAIHPRCPCSDATVAQLARALAGRERETETIVLVYEPSSADPTWAATRLVEACRRLPGTRVVEDLGGRTAAAFGMLTSGHTTVYGTDGTLRFSGGITPARGHEGDNAGGAALRELIAGRRPGVTGTPVYGCALQTPAEDGCCR